jgi:hypothetical protein
VAVSDRTGVRVPDLTAARAWLTALADPFVDVRLAGGPLSAPAALVAAVEAHPAVVSALDRQRADGSWGADDDWRRRVLPTLQTATVLAELGLSVRHDSWSRAADFLGSVAHTADGVFSRTGDRAGVLSCYVGIAGSTYLLGGRRDLAGPQIAWVLRHQDVRRGGVSSRPGPVEVYHPAMATRYGGCLSGTTCLIGLVKTGRALELWTRVADDADARAVLAAIRAAFLERHLFRRADGGVPPLGTPASDPEGWLLPSFPLDWRTDLVEVLDLVARTGPAEVRMQPGLDRIAEMQLPDGTWPVRRAFWPPDLPAVERRDRRRGSPIVTMRVVAALSAAEVKNS